MKKGLWGYIGVLVPAAVVVIAAVLILSMYSFSSSLSRHAARINNSVNICRSIADIYIGASGEKELKENFAAMGYEANEESEGYSLAPHNSEGPQVRLSVKNSESGSIEEITVTALDGETEIYSLSTSKYIESEGNADG